jgi:hypothetical protein
MFNQRFLDGFCYRYYYGESRMSASYTISNRVGGRHKIAYYPNGFTDSLPVPVPGRYSLKAAKAKILELVWAIELS